MIIKGIKNYLINLKYVFTPLGTLFLGVVIGLSVLIPDIVSAVEYVVSEVSALAESTVLDLSAMWNSFLREVSGLNWSDPISAIRTALNEQWLEATFFSCINALVGDIETYREAIMRIIQTAVGFVASGTVAFIVWTVVGFVGGYFLTRFLVRRNIAKRALWKFLLVSFVGSLLSATLVATCLVMIAALKLGALWSFILTLMLTGFVSLFEAYIVHGNKQIKPVEIINVFNIARLFLSDLLILTVALLISAAVSSVLKGPVSLFVWVPLIEIALIVISMNAESYVKSVAEKKKALLTAAPTNSSVSESESINGERVLQISSVAAENLEHRGTKGKTDSLTTVSADKTHSAVPDYLNKKFSEDGENHSFITSDFNAAKATDNHNSGKKNKTYINVYGSKTSNGREEKAVKTVDNRDGGKKNRTQGNYKSGNKKGKAANESKTDGGKTTSTTRD